MTAGDDGALITWVLDDWTASFRDWMREGERVLMPRDDRTLVYDRPDGSFVGISADPDIWLERACAVAGRGLSEQEWQTVFADRPYDPGLRDRLVRGAAIDSGAWSPCNSASTRPRGAPSST